MSRRRRSRRASGGAASRARKLDGSPPKPGTPKSGYREYLERCEFSGREPVDFTSYLRRARRWRKEYAPAKDRGDFELVRELEDLLCV